MRNVIINNVNEDIEFSIVGGSYKEALLNIYIEDINLGKKSLEDLAEDGILEYDTEGSVIPNLYFDKDETTYYFLINFGVGVKEENIIGTGDLNLISFKKRNKDNEIWYENYNTENYGAVLKIIKLEVPIIEGTSSTFVLYVAAIIPILKENYTITDDTIEFESTNTEFEKINFGSSVVDISSISYKDSSNDTIVTYTNNQQDEHNDIKDILSSSTENNISHYIVNLGEISNNISLHLGAANNLGYKPYVEFTDSVSSINHFTSGNNHKDLSATYTYDYINIDEEEVTKYIIVGVTIKGVNYVISCIEIILKEPGIFDNTVDDESNYWGEESSYYLIDTNTGADYDPTSLLFKSNHTNIYKAIELKDTRLFLGNFKNVEPLFKAQQLLYDSIDGGKTYNSIISNLIYTEASVPLATTGTWYNYSPDLALSSLLKRLFKKGENYYLGLVFISDTGYYSPVYPLRECFENGGILAKFEPRIITNELNLVVLKKPVMKVKISGKYTLDLITNGIIAVMPVCAINDSHNIICQGIPSRVMTNKNNNFLYSWYLRWQGENNGDMDNTEMPSARYVPIPNYSMPEDRVPQNENFNAAKRLLNNAIDALDANELPPTQSNIDEYKQSLRNAMESAEYIYMNENEDTKYQKSLWYIQNSVNPYLKDTDRVNILDWNHYRDMCRVNGVKEEFGWKVFRLNLEILSINSPELEVLDNLFGTNFRLSNVRVVDLLRANHTAANTNPYYVNNLYLEVTGSLFPKSKPRTDCVNPHGTTGNWYASNYKRAKEVYPSKNFTLNYKARDITTFRFTDGWYWFGYSDLGTVNDYNWPNYINDTNDEDNINKYHNYGFHLVFPWNKPRIGGENTEMVKRIFNCLYFKANNTLSSDTNVYTCLDADIYRGLAVLKINNTPYYGDVDMLITTENGYRQFVSTPMFWGRYGDTNTDYLALTHIYPSLKAIENHDNYAVHYNDDVNILLAGPNFILGTGNHNGFLGAVTKDAIPMKYKVAKHLICKLDKPFVENSEVLNIVEFYKEYQSDSSTAENILKSKVWIKCGDIRRLKEEKNCVITFEEGDYFYGRFDSLRTYPYSENETNNITEIVSIPLASRINLDARYDRNRGVEDSTVNPTNFNLFNPVYNLLNNYFKYFYVDTEDEIIDRTYEATILWSKNKTYGSEIDDWCNIPDSSVLDLDGDKGPIVAIVNYNDNLWAFQERAISLILYNENLKTESTAGLSVELLNSNVVLGKRVIKTNMGVLNPKAICKIPNAVIFIDSINKTIIMLSSGNRGEINTIDLCALTGMKSWAMKNLTKDWICYYDIYTQEVIFTNTKEPNPYDCIIYDTIHLYFTCFASYEGKEWSFYLNRRQYIAEGNIWLKNAKNSITFFNENKPIEVELLVNPEPVLDKTFTNIEYRADAFLNDVYKEDFSFTNLRVYNEYQDTGTVELSTTNTNKELISSNLKKKFRIWGIEIPRNEGSRDRIRNPWCKVLLKINDSENLFNLFKLYDVLVTYMLP